MAKNTSFRGTNYYWFYLHPHSPSRHSLAWKVAICLKTKINFCFFPMLSIIHAYRFWNVVVIISHHFPSSGNQQVSCCYLIIHRQFACNFNETKLTLYIGVPQKSLRNTFLSGVCCLRSRLSFIALMSSKTKPQSSVL